MATKTPAAVSLDDLVAAFEFVSFDGQAEHRAYICTDTGTIHYLTDDPKLNEGVPEDIEESDQYIAVPDKRELDLGRDQVFAFVARELPDEWDTVRDLFRRRGAYRRLKDFSADHRDAGKMVSIRTKIFRGRFALVVWGERDPGPRTVAAPNAIDNWSGSAPGTLMC